MNLDANSTIEAGKAIWMNPYVNQHTGMTIVSYGLAFRLLAPRPVTE